MTEIIKSLEVDVAKQNTFRAIVAKQGDKSSRFLKVRLLNEGTPLNVSQDCIVSINTQRSDEESRAFAGIVNDDGTVTVPLTAWMLEIDGTLMCSISVIDSNEKRLSSTSFMVTVELAEFCDETIADDDQRDLFLQLLRSAQNEEQRVVATQNANNAATNANSAANSANTATQQLLSLMIDASGTDLKVLPIYDEDNSKYYTYQLVIENGYPTLKMIEKETN